MAIYSSSMVVFGVGILVVISLCCMKTIEGNDGEEKLDDSDVTLHAVGCNSHSDAGEQCTGEDDKLGLYSDVDDTFKVVKNVADTVTNKLQHGLIDDDDDDDDSPDILHNNVDVLGH
ncbi:hypothetical protein Lal_00048315 [Lupinus albus]|uniref:Uncharacterized protein n=1 Tax=Lupinus albus TaxID=3870 RepID=A0A6A4QLY6_LUPAL|nr:hypothetical protein Lalb_Chr04g0250211 [Lupinus albus]KAF1869035.1 hypothetical protein Lal_00048315 [Lupinus albus]